MTVHRFRIRLSDVDRNVYQSLDLRVARHPSESVPYLLTRVIAYALNVQEGLAFAVGGLSDPDEPALRVRDLTGATTYWIEVGNPSARRLHKATKVSHRVRVYTYREFDILAQELRPETIHRKEHIEFFALAPPWLEALGNVLARDNDWEALHTDGEFTVTVNGTAFPGELVRHSLPR